MSWFFGKKKKETGPTPDQVSEGLSAKIEQLNKRVEHIEKQGAEEQRKAVQFAKAKNKRKAMECLKRKKLFENQSAQLTQIISNLETQQFQIQQAALNASVFKEYQNSTIAIKNAMGDLNSDKIEEIRDEMDEAQATLQDLTDMISQPIGASVDEGELEDEFAGLLEMDEEVVEEPGETVRPVKGKEDEELGDLMANFA